MYSEKLNLIKQKIDSLIRDKITLQEENENLIEKIRVLEQKIQIEKSGTERIEKKPERVQKSEKVDAPTLFDTIHPEEMKEQIELCIEDIDQCIEIIEKK